MPVEVERCVSRIKPSLKKQYPNKSDQEITQIAWGTCTKLYKAGKLSELTEKEKLDIIFNRKK